MRPTRYPDYPQFAFPLTVIYGAFGSRRRHIAYAPSCLTPQESTALNILLASDARVPGLYRIDGFGSLFIDTTAAMRLFDPVT